jgi:hypothetical protein
MRHQAEQYALVLSAMGMRSSIAMDGEYFALSVGYRDAARASYELAAYDRENHDTLPRQDRPLRHFLSTGSEREQLKPD